MICTNWCWFVQIVLICTNCVDLVLLLVQIGDKSEPKHYTAADLKLGETLLLFGRKVTICDCDGYTKKWFGENMEIFEFKKVDSTTLLPQRPPLPQPELSPWHEGNRQGGYLDSLQNCLHLDPKPVVHDSLQKLYYNQECLRYQAKLVRVPWLISIIIKFIMNCIRPFIA